MRAPLRALLVGAMAILATAAARPVQADDWGINVYGLSYHFDRDRARALDVDNEFNPGVGVRYKFAEWRVSFHAEAGNLLRLRPQLGEGSSGAVALWEVLPRFHIGGALALFHSDTYNHGDAFVAPLPLLAYDIGPATLNLTYFPQALELQRCRHARLLGHALAAALVNASHAARVPWREHAGPQKSRSGSEGTFRTGYGAGKQRVGVVRLDRSTRTAAKYRWEGGSHTGVAATLKEAKRACEEAVLLGAVQLPLFDPPQRD